MIYLKKIRKIKIYKFPYSIKQLELIKFFDESLSEYVVLGIGNIVGWGELLIEKNEGI